MRQAALLEVVPEARERRELRLKRRQVRASIDRLRLRRAKLGFDSLALGKLFAIVLGEVRATLAIFELARKVRDRFPELPILLTNGYSEEVGGSHGFPVLQKPYELDAMAAAVGKLLKQKIAAS